MITFKKQIIDPAHIINKNQRDIKDGQPWDMLACGTDKRGRQTRKKGWVIWDGANFIFYPWRKNSKYIKLMQRLSQERKEAE